jgi:thioesterase domain-containing protein
VLIFYQLARIMGTERPFYGLQSPHPVDLGEQYTSIEEMAARYVEALVSVQPEGPYLLGGFSFGSVVAFEVSQQLQASRREVALLALIDGTSPLIMQQGAEQTDVAMLAGLARDLARTAGVELALPHEELARLESVAALNLILDRLKSVNLIAPDIEMTWIRRLIQGSRSRTSAVRNYRPSVYPGVITLLRSSEVEAESAKAWREIGVDVRDGARGWDELSARPVEIHYISGHHATMLQEPHVRQLAAQLGACLDRAQHIGRHV